MTTMTGYVPYTGANAPLDMGLQNLSGTTQTMGNSTNGGSIQDFGALQELAPALTTGNWSGVDGTIMVYDTSPNAIEKVADGTFTVAASSGTIVSGGIYKVVIDVTVTVSGFISNFGGVTLYQKTGSTYSNIFSTTGVYTLFVLATSTQKIQFQQNTTTSRFKLNSVSVKRITLGNAVIEGVLQTKSPILDADGNTIMSFAAPGQIILVQTGTQLSPAITFSGSLSTGIYQPASNKIAMVGGNQGGAVFDGSTGGIMRLGIGVSNGSPQTSFHVLSDTNSTATGLGLGLTTPAYIYKSATDTISMTGAPQSITATVAMGYGVGAGSVVTQLTNKSTGVTLNNPCGQITMNNAALAATTTVSFTLTDSRIAATDEIGVSRSSGGTAASYSVWVDSVAAGSCVIAVRNLTAGSLSEALVLVFNVHKGSNT